MGQGAMIGRAREKYGNGVARSAWKVMVMGTKEVD